MRVILFCLVIVMAASSAKARNGTTRLPNYEGRTVAIWRTIWRAPDTSIANRLAAAQQLLSVGMNTYDVENTLGEPSQRKRYGFGLIVGTPPDKHPRIQWWYDYRFPDGIITVCFLQVMDADRFEAEYQSVHIGREPVWIPVKTVEEQPTMHLEPISGSQ